MPGPFQLTDDERSFLRHWTYEASCPFWGPASIWCKNHRISSAYGPYPMAELYWAQEIEAGREGWIFERPPIPFRVSWRDAEQFWLRYAAALALIPRLQGDDWATMSAFTWQVEGTLTPDESNYLRAYYQEMVESGSGHYIDLAQQHGALGPRTSAHDPRDLPLVRLPCPIRGTVWHEVLIPGLSLDLWIIPKRIGRAAPSIAPSVAPTNRVEMSSYNKIWTTIHRIEIPEVRTRVLCAARKKPMPNRLFAIGDIHGCNLALRTLIAAIDPKPDDTIVVLGDVIDWGPDSRDCVQQLIDLSGRCQFILVRGNHEEMLYAVEISA
jgi:hypothetical protein